MSDIPPGSIVITPQEVYTEVKALTDVVRALVEKDKTDTTREDLATLQGRVRSLEQFKWAFLGAAMASGGIAGSVATRLLS